MTESQPGTHPGTSTPDMPLITIPIVIVTTLQGELEITTEAGSGKAKEPNAGGQVSDVVDRVPFLFLGLDLPAAPLYKDVMETNIIPQVPSHLQHTCLVYLNYIKAHNKHLWIKQDNTCYAHA